MNDCIVVSVDYRLAPEYQYPAAHEDAYQAIKWIKKNIVRYGGNSQNMLVAGDSAGAAIAASMAHRCHRDGIRLRAQILIYPWIDGRLTNPSLDRNGEGYMLTKKAIVWFQKQYTPRAEDHCLPDVSPCYESDFTDLPPAFILTAELDPLIDDGYRYFHQLKAGGTPCHYHEYKGLIHGFINIPMIAPEAMSAFDDIKKFLAGIG
jgi:acetyl esterase